VLSTPTWGRETVETEYEASVRTTDYHTAGEPFRIVVGGTPTMSGATVLERREFAQGSAGVEDVRKLLCHEPRGHSDMYGCFLVPPNDEGAHLGVLFWHKDGYSTACGHGTIALGAWAVQTGRVRADPDGDTEVVIDVPSGRVVARVSCSDGTVDAVAFRNVPSYVVARDLKLKLSAGPVCVDVSYGGAFYASAPASAFGLSVTPDNYSDLIQIGREVKSVLQFASVAKHPDDPRLSGLYGTILYDDLGDTPVGVHQRNVTIFADGEVDRSPCGSGTSARVALLVEQGRMKPGQILTHDSLIGTRFDAQLVELTVTGDRASVIVDVRGMAYRTGEHVFYLDARDPVGTGFVLR
jgi:proline racemase